MGSKPCLGRQRYRDKHWGCQPALGMGPGAMPALPVLCHGLHMPVLLETLPPGLSLPCHQQLTHHLRGGARGSQGGQDTGQGMVPDSHVPQQFLGVHAAGLGPAALAAHPLHCPRTGLECLRQSRARAKMQGQGALTHSTGTGTALLWFWTSLWGCSSISQDCFIFVRFSPAPDTLPTPTQGMSAPRPTHGDTDTWGNGHPRERGQGHPTMQKKPHRVLQGVD